MAENMPGKESISCLRGRHKWLQVKPDRLALLRGEVITHQRCERCGRERTKAR